MITINTLKIDENLKNIEVEVTSDNISARFTNVFLWTVDNFRNYETVFDVSDLLLKTTNTEQFVIPVERINSTLYSGFFFIEFRTDEDPTPDDNGVVQNQILGIVGNIYKYKECLLEKSLMIKVESCEKIVTECPDCTKNIYLISTLLKSVDIAVLENLYEETVKFAKELDNLCEICHTCPNYDDVIAFNGVGLNYQITNNQVFNI